MVSKNCIYGLIGGSLGLLVLGFLCEYAIFPPIIKSMTMSELNLNKDNTEGYQNFVTPPVPIYMNFYVFNVENVDAVVGSDTVDGMKPRVTYKGPYSYLENRTKINITHESDELLRYGQYKNYEFNQENSCQDCNADDEVWMPNGPLVGIMALIPPIPILGDELLLYIDHLITGEEYTGKLVDCEKGTLLDPNPFATTPADCEKDLTDDNRCLCEVFQQINTMIPTCATDPSLCDTPFIKVKVDDLLFGGIIPGTLKITLDILNMLNQFGINLPIQLPPVIDPERGFAIFNGKFDTTYNEHYEIHTGKGNKTKYVEIQQWGPTADELQPNLNAAEWWDVNKGYNGSNMCNELNGATDGQQYHPFLSEKNDNRLWIFQTDICRSLFIELYDQEFCLEQLDDANLCGEDIKKVEGIPVMRYWTPPKALASNTKDNFGFCKQVASLNDNQWDDCLKEDEFDNELLNMTDCYGDGRGKLGPEECANGVMDITKCMGGAPVEVSSPLFYQSPSFLREKFEDFPEPNFEDHATVIDVEPITGMAIAIKKRLQINLPVLKDDRISGYSHLNVDKTLYPLIYIEETAYIDEANKKKLNNMVYTPLAALEGVSWTLVALGAVGFLGSLIWLTMK